MYAFLSDICVHIHTQDSYACTYVQTYVPACMYIHAQKLAFADLHIQAVAAKKVATEEKARCVGWLFVHTLCLHTNVLERRNLLTSKLSNRTGNKQL